MFKPLVELVSDVGIGKIKHSSKMAWGFGQMIVGLATEEQELVVKGSKNLKKGAMGLCGTMVGTMFFKDSKEENNTDDDGVDSGE